ncbi:hypothetical protein [Aliivibrio fischeri]|uniref:hypothetical protein n=1 Tax=Aliivibrio fischeri TaxID=668 RepID=UPI0011BF5705|nr:hypothetical protein [Aliivibrio fischeri]
MVSSLFNIKWALLFPALILFLVVAFLLFFFADFLFCEPLQERDIRSKQVQSVEVRDELLIFQSEPLAIDASERKVIDQNGDENE